MNRLFDDINMLKESWKYFSRWVSKNASIAPPRRFKNKILQRVFPMVDGQFNGARSASWL